MDEHQANPDMSDLQAECQWLRKQVQIILILVILISATLTLFLWRQVRYLSADLTGVRPGIEEYNKNQGPQMDDFIKRLVEYSKGHPEFNAIAKKYNLDQVNLAGAVAPKK